MHKKQLRQEVQDLLLQYAANAFYALSDGNASGLTDNPETQAELKKQFQRIEKLFGVDKGSTKS